mmetsp:Transcript_84535/g.215215  ORF Transcript_84535/g.215215 Transcript_84535/m.215215 type:complete len:211 (+) Transcript_84535:52-684(+)
MTQKPQAFRSLVGVRAQSSAAGSTERKVGSSSPSTMAGSLGTSSWRPSKTSRKKVATPSRQAACSKALLAPAAAQSPAAKAKVERRKGPLGSSQARVRRSANSAAWRSFGTPCARMRCTAVGTLQPWASSFIAAVNTFLKALGSKAAGASAGAGGCWAGACATGTAVGETTGEACATPASRTGRLAGLSVALPIAAANLAAALQPDMLSV